MGMFDYLVCEVPLPDGRVVEGAVWQTKDGPCEMGTVTISAGGRFLVEDAHYDEVPREQRPYPDADDGLMALCGSIRRVIDRVVDTEHHGDVFFYRSTDLGDEWEEYVARFTNGQLQSIAPVESLAAPTTKDGQ